jgi:hypothetical protein
VIVFKWLFPFRNKRVFETAPATATTSEHYISNLQQWLWQLSESSRRPLEGNHLIRLCPGFSSNLSPAPSPSDHKGVRMAPSMTRATMLELQRHTVILIRNGPSFNKAGQGRMSMLILCKRRW